MNLQDPNLPSKLARNPNHKQWTTGITNDGRVYIQDDNFEYDARLYINGDFYDQELQLNYANAIAGVLNSNDKLRYVLKQMTTMMESGDEPGINSPWYKLAIEALGE